MGSIQESNDPQIVGEGEEVRGHCGSAGHALNAICPYFTMFPLEFPLRILKPRARKGEAVLDPFCGRGTTNLAARLLGLDSLGVDSSRVAAAITASKLVRTDADAIVEEARNILDSDIETIVPTGEFWEWAFDTDVLDSVCRLRGALIQDCSTDARIALRGVCLGALHGPRQKTMKSYFSNQCPRTYAPKPGYSIRYWQERGLAPEHVDVLDVIDRRARRYYNLRDSTRGEVRLGDSRSSDAFNWNKGKKRFNWVITSPPYYGMRTYIPDQWLRNWFVGGPSSVEYASDGQVTHSSPEAFAADLRQVWCNAFKACTKKANMVIRFGGIADRNVEPREIVKQSLIESGWRVLTIKEAGSASVGKRQANTFLRFQSQALQEIDVWARK